MQGRGENQRKGGMKGSSDREEDRESEVGERGQIKKFYGKGLFGCGLVKAQQ